MSSVFKRIGYGLIIWVVPYVCSIPLLPLMRSDVLVFKAIMVSIGSITAATVISLYFLKVTKSYFKEALITAITWLLLNWALDMLAVVPFTHQSGVQYFLQIGTEYLAFVSPVIAIGYLLEKKTKKT